MKKYYITIFCLLVFILDVLAQPCSVPALGTTYEANSNACILFPSVSSTEQLIVGNIYQIEGGNIYYDETECPEGNPGRCNDPRESWSFSNNIRNFESNGSMYIEVLTDQEAFIIYNLDQTPLDYPEENLCSTNCRGYSKLKINAVGNISSPICTELCPGVGLKSSGFEGVETGWEYTAGYLDADQKYIPFDPTTPSTEHTIIDGSNYNIFPYGDPGENFNSGNTQGQGFNPFTTSNQKAIALGHGDTRNADGIGGKDYYLSRMEQTFFVGENYEPKLDIWYSWVTSVTTYENLKTQPVFSIKLFRLYEDRNADGELITVKEEIYSHIDTQETYDDKSSDDRKRWRHWWDKKTIDLTSYKLERLHLEITSYDRKHISTDFNSMAFVDIACSTCCTPSEVANDETQSLTISPISSGIVTIERPTKICEDPSIAIDLSWDPNIDELSQRRRCNPIFFYQIIDPNGEPYIIESGEPTVSFRPTMEGQYQIRYKENISCCWSDTRTFPDGNEIISETQIQSSGVTFSNDLKSAAISCIPSFEMNQVLAVNVASFGDRQLIDPKDIVTSNRKAIVSQVAVTEPKNPYLTGERGIWRTAASYAYVTDREGYEDDENMNAVKEGGTFNLNMFNWTTQGVVPDNWRRVNHVSRYDGYTHEIENRDILGRYSSALYGYNGQLATAVASNAAYYEIANEGFDAYQENFTEVVSSLLENCGTNESNLQIIPYNGVMPNIPNFNGEISFPFAGYEEGKYYAFTLSNIDCINTTNNAVLSWFALQGGTDPHQSTDNTIFVIQIRDNIVANGKFKITFQAPEITAPCLNIIDDLCIEGVIKQPSLPIQTETNFEINNLYKDGDKDRNVILQVLWAKGDKGVLEGYTPGEGETVTLDASVLAYTIGKQEAMDITPNLSVNTTENTYAIDEKVQIRLTHRDATTSWFTLEAINGYTLPEEWSEKDEQWYGSVRLARTLPSIGNTDGNNPRNYEALTPVAHTGNQGLVPSEDIIIQEKLLLIPGKEYVFSAWVKANISEDQPYTYGDVVGADLSFYANGSSTALQDPIEIHPTGAIIEGWQRIEGTFIVPTGSMFIGVELTQSTNGAVYDDIRIYPANGMMKTYVYNPSNYLLQAVLDENNYATLYYYDEEQRLYLVQKETREGVQTIQETRSYIKPLLPKSTLTENNGE